MTQKRTCIPSLMPIKSTNSSSVLIPQPQREESCSRRNGKLQQTWFQNWSQRKTWSIHMSTRDMSQTSLTSKEYGSTTESMSSDWNSLSWSTKAQSPSKMLTTSENSLILPMHQLSPCTFTEDSANSHILSKTLNTNPLLRLWSRLDSTELNSTERLLSHSRSNSGINMISIWSSMNKTWLRNYPHSLSTHPTRLKLRLWSMEELMRP